MHAAGGYPLEFGTISVSDGISMGHEGMHFSLVSREVIADSVETVMMAERLDGSVLLAGCDKSLPGMLMAAARLDLASVFLYAGSIMPGASSTARATSRSSTRSRRSAPACAGLITREEVDAIERRDLPGRGRLRRHVHREHDGVGRRGARHVAARVAPRRRRSTGAATGSRAGRARPSSSCSRQGITARADHDQARRSRTRSPS